MAGALALYEERPHLRHRILIDIGSPTSLVDCSETVLYS
jgi:hypothetical protein